MWWLMGSFTLSDVMSVELHLLLSYRLKSENSNMSAPFHTIVPNTVYFWQFLMFTCMCHMMYLPICHHLQYIYLYYDAQQKIVLHIWLIIYIYYETAFFVKRFNLTGFAWPTQSWSWSENVTWSFVFFSVVYPHQKGIPPGLKPRFHRDH